MQTFSINRLAEMFERDRSTMVRALRSVHRDAGSPDRPTYKISTASRALQDHFAAKSDSRSEPSTELQAKFEALDRLDARVRSAPTLDERRRLVRELFVMLNDVDDAMRDHARAALEDPELTGYRCEKHIRTMLATLRECCGWNFDEIMREFNIAIEMSMNDA